MVTRRAAVAVVLARMVSACSESGLASGSIDSGTASPGSDASLDAGGADSGLDAAADQSSDAGPSAVACMTPIAFYIDPAQGDDAHDGTTAATAKKSLDALPSGLRGNTTVALKRGTLLRLRKAVQLHGSASGPVCYGTYGDSALPKPIVAASAPILAAAWSAPDGGGLRTLDWTPYLINDGQTSLTGAEQGPGNLWFFDADADGAAMTGWGWRKPALSGVTAERDWYYDPTSHQITLKWSAAAPPATEASIAFEPALSFAGQSNVIVEDWDLRYLGGYALRGHAASHIRLRRLDAAFIGGGTKTGAYVRLGNGFESNGAISDVVLEDSKFYQIFDTAFDPQNTGGSSTQTDLVFRSNLVSKTGLAGMELWMQPAGTQIQNLSVTGNVFAQIGYGWGYEQHDFPGTVKLGAGIFVSSNQATTTGISITGNLFASSRLMMVASWGASNSGSVSLVQGMTMDDNQWSSIGNPAVVLFTGTIGSDGTPVLGSSPVYADLAAWQASVDAPGKDKHSVEVSSPSLPKERPVTRFGAFPLAP